MEGPALTVPHDLILEHEQRLLQSSAAISEGRGLLPGDDASSDHCRGNSDGSNQLSGLQKDDTGNVYLCKQNNSSLAEGGDSRTDQPDHASFSVDHRFSTLPSENCNLAQYKRFSTSLGSYHFHRSTRLKQRRQMWVLQAMQHLISLSFATSVHVRWKNRTSSTTTLVLFLFLLSTLIYPAASENGIQSHQKSHSSSPFHPWMIAYVDSDAPQVSERSKLQPFQFPDFIIAANKLFQYQIPHAAFSGMELIQHYQVCDCIFVVAVAVVVFLPLEGVCIFKYFRYYNNLIFGWHRVMIMILIIIFMLVTIM